MCEPLDILKEYSHQLSLINLDILDRYIDLIKTNNEEELIIKNMIYTFIEEIDYMSPDKQSRWLGYIQKSMLDLKLIKLDEERDITRIMFHSLYKKFNLPIKKISVVKNIKSKEYK